MPGIARNNRHAPKVILPRSATCELAEHESNCHGDRNDPNRKQEEHRDEHKLGRDRETGSDLELHSRRCRVRDEQQGDRSYRRAPRRVDQHRKGDGSHEETATDDQRCKPFPMGKRQRPPSAAFLDEGISLRIEVSRVTPVKNLGGALYCGGHSRYIGRFRRRPKSRR
jgi:hypothetical protein